MGPHRCGHVLKTEFVTGRAVQCATNIRRNLVMLQPFLLRMSLALGLSGQCEVGMCSNHLFNTRLESSASTIFADPGNVSVDSGVSVFKLVRITYGSRASHQFSK